ncbi:MAG: hypothetical protein MUO50_17220, partial [Longimicrobiales bacterium]|nr:hypothetical protein [Longimicrobiales bacterium]
SPEVFDEAVESVVEESETTFEETEANFQEVEPSFGEAERTFGEPETAFGEPETAFAPPPPAFVETVEEPPEPTPVAASLFGKRDPMEKAQRLARVLVSDIILYNPDRHYDATESGRVKEEFQEEIQKSWNEYVEQVGEELANSTDFFNDALNEILAKGDPIF